MRRDENVWMMVENGWVEGVENESNDRLGGGGCGKDASKKGGRLNACLNGFQGTLLFLVSLFFFSFFLKAVNGLGCLPSSTLFSVMATT